MISECCTDAPAFVVFIATQ